MDALNWVTKLHFKDYPDDHAFMNAILDTIKKCKTFIGYGIFNDYNFVSDMRHLESNCKNVGLLDRYTGVIDGLQRIVLIYRLYLTKSAI